MVDVDPEYASAGFAGVVVEEVGLRRVVAQRWLFANRNATADVFEISLHHFPRALGCLKIFWCACGFVVVEPGFGREQEIGVGFAQGVMGKREGLLFAHLVNEKILNEIALNGDEIFGFSDGRLVHEKAAVVSVISVVAEASVRAHQEIGVVRRRVQPVVETPHHRESILVADATSGHHSAREIDAVVVAPFIYKARQFRVHEGAVIEHAVAVGVLALLDDVDNVIDDGAQVVALFPPQCIRSGAEKTAFGGGGQTVYPETGTGRFGCIENIGYVPVEGFAKDAGV